MQIVGGLVELVGIEPTTSSLPTMRSAKKPQFGVHLATDYGPDKKTIDRLTQISGYSSYIQYRMHLGGDSKNYLRRSPLFVR